MRYFLIIGFVVLAIFLWRRSARRDIADSKPSSPATQKIVLCRRCGTYLPEEEAVLDGECFYCSPEHRDQDKKLDS